MQGLINPDADFAPLCCPPFEVSFTRLIFRKDSWTADQGRESGLSSWPFPPRRRARRIRRQSKLADQRCSKDTDEFRQEEPWHTTEKHVRILDVSVLALPCALLPHLSFALALSGPSAHLLIGDNAHLPTREASEFSRRTLPGRLSLGDRELVDDPRESSGRPHEVNNHSDLETPSVDLHVV